MSLTARSARPTRSGTPPLRSPRPRRVDDVQRPLQRPDQLTHLLSAEVLARFLWLAEPHRQGRDRRERPPGQALLGNDQLPHRRPAPVQQSPVAVDNLPVDAVDSARLVLGCVLGAVLPAPVQQSGSGIPQASASWVSWWLDSSMVRASPGVRI